MIGDIKISRYVSLKYLKHLKIQKNIYTKFTNIIS